MSSFFTAPGAQKRKRPSANEAPKKRLATASKGYKSNSRAPPSKPAPASKKIDRDESISGSDLDSEDGDDVPERAGSEGESEESEDEKETAAEKRLRLAQRYLEKTRQEVEEIDTIGFDAEEIDRDLLAERLQEDIAEAKGRIYRKIASELDFQNAAHTQFRWNSASVTSVAVCSPYAYTTTKDGELTKWRLQDLPKDQWPQTTKKKPKKPPAPPKRKPDRICFSKADSKRAKDKSYQGHIGAIIAVKASQDGKFVVTGGVDRRMVIHNAEDLKPIRAFSHHRDAVTGLAFRRGTNQLYSCSKDRTVKVWSLDELAYIETLFGHQDEILDIDALAQERCVSVGARDRTARYWKVPEESQLVFRGGGPGEKKRKASAVHEGSMDRVAMIDDEMFITGSDNGDVALWSIHRKKAVFTISCAHGRDSALKLSEVSAERNPDPKVIPTPQPRAITALRTIPYADVVLTGSWDGYVRVWRLSDDKKKLEAIGVLGGVEGGQAAPMEGVVANGVAVDAAKTQKTGNSDLVKGIVNDIALFERGDRGRDGLCVVVGTGKEMRLGRWKFIKDGRCGAMVFEVPKLPKPKGANGDVADHEDEEK
ncbi:WD40-repeat-containing domain protein [Lasiosphaeris hirsuta]|uniref:WD40-repeat-containing domain protein n=1 Tax=Lasiosphaeris hirsuta TaxID=260670 RepID=A0AA40AR03_9PEZI|nr:WD40-repeat-containing domain protein [Lasiosphaeris hirsuta]